nr:hypothetical protein [Candidatus Electrothrix aestuarii]
MTYDQRLASVSKGGDAAEAYRRPCQRKSCFMTGLAIFRSGKSCGKPEQLPS